MPAFEVARTLVKSPPEVWAELEQAERLAALLGDEAITITQIDPEKAIEWQGAAAHGRIEISASSWGTKVRLTTEVEELSVVEVVDVEVSEVSDGSEVSEVSDAIEVQSEPVPESETEAALEPVIDDSVAPKRSFWAKMKSWFNSENVIVADAETVVETEQENSPASEVPAPALIAEVDAEAGMEAAEAEFDSEPETKAKSDSEPQAEPESEPVAESIDYEQRMVALLDHLGSAHKRPFINA